MIETASKKAMIAHNLGLGAFFGGSLFGQVALNPTVSRISDKQERGRVLNESWGRYNAVNFAAMAASLLAWRLGGVKGDAELRAPGLARLKNLLLGGMILNGVAAGILGARLTAQAPPDAPPGGTPVESGTQPAPETPQEAASSQRAIAFVGTSATALAAIVISLSAVIEASAPKPRGVLSKLLS